MLSTSLISDLLPSHYSQPRTKKQHLALLHHRGSASDILEGEAHTQRCLAYWLLEACSQVLGSSVPTIRCCTNLLAPKEDLKGQKVAVIGVGKCGRAAARLALARGANVVAFDKNQHLVPLENDPLFGEYNNFKTVLGECDRSILEETDRVVVSPGVPLENYGLHALLQSGKDVVSELDFAAEALPEEIKIIGITGTNGKSTTTVFAGQMLHYLGIKTFVGGNLGHPLSEAAIQCLKSPSANKILEVAVVEVSSYMMEIPHKWFSPAVAVALNLTPDHLERHKTMRNYAEMKCRVFAKMKCGKLAILPTGDQYLKAAFSEHAPKCNVAWIGDLPGIKVDTEKKVATLKIPTTGVVAQLQLGELKTMGTHNYLNAAVAGFSVLGLDTGIDPDFINATLQSLSPPSHRLQIVHRDIRGVTWVDDSKATNVEATYAGLMGLRNKKSIVLLGGLAKILGDKEPNGFEKLIEPLRHHKCIITFGASGEMIQKTLKDGGLAIPCLRTSNLEGAVDLARSMAISGEAIVLSPACASFDGFRNFEHRGKVFQELALSEP